MKQTPFQLRKLGREPRRPGPRAQRGSLPRWTPGSASGWSPTAWAATTPARSRAPASSSSSKTIGVSTSASDQHARFVDRLTQANHELQDYSQRNGGSIVGSTVAALLIYEGEYRCLWVGDSRIYLVRAGELAQISRDHSEVQELVEQGVLSREEARTWRGRNVITRAVGVYPEIDIEAAYGEMEDGDTFLLCSDGLTAHASDDDILEAVTGRGAKAACEILLELVLERGATDNVTVVITQVRKYRRHGADGPRRLRGGTVSERHGRRRTGRNGDEPAPRAARTCRPARRSATPTRSSSISRSAAWPRSIAPATSTPTSRWRSRSCCPSSRATRPGWRCSARKRRCSAACTTRRSSTTTCSRWRRRPTGPTS